MDEKEFLFSLKKIKIDEDKIKIDENIFSGLGSKQEIDQRFTFYRRKFNQNLEKNTQLYERAKLKFNLQSTPSNQIHLNMHLPQQQQQLSTSRTQITPGNLTDRPSSSRQQQNGKSFFKSNNQSIASLNTNTSLLMMMKNNNSSRPSSYKQHSSLKNSRNTSRHEKKSSKNFSQHNKQQQEVSENKNLSILSMSSRLHSNQSKRRTMSALNLKIPKPSFPDNNYNNNNNQPDSQFNINNCQVGNQLLLNSIIGEQLSPPLYSNITNFASILLQVVNSSEKQNIFLIKQACDDFGINCDELQKIDNVQDRENYVIACMKNSVRQNLVAWQEKIRQKEITNRQLNKKNLEEFEKQFSAKDVFDWLQIKTNFQTLKKKVRFQIVEIFNNQDNMAIAEEHLKNKNNVDSPGIKNKNNNNNNNNNSPKINTNSTISNNKSNINNYNNEIAEKNIFQQKKPNDNCQNQLTQESQQFGNSINESKQYVDFIINQYQNDKEKALILENMKSTQRGLSTKEKEQLIKILQNTMLNDQEDLQIKLAWDDEKEQQFKENRKKAVQLLHNSVHSSSWNNIAAVPIMRELNVIDRGYQYRQELINKFMDNNILTDKEAQFLANTSELLNSHINKKHLQKSVDLLSPQVIDNIELQIAEKIIEKYFVVLNKVKKERENYIQEKVNNDLKIIENEKLMKLQQSKQQQLQIQKSDKLKNKIEKPSPQQMLRLKDKILRIFKKLQLSINNQQKQLILKRNQSAISFQQNNQNQNSAEKQRQEFLNRNFFDKNSQNKQIFDHKDQELTLEKVQRLFHPPSKVIIGLKKLNNYIVNPSTPKSPTKQQQQKEKEYAQNKFVQHLLHQKQIQKQFKLSVNRYQQEEQQNDFKEYYTQGPVNVREYKSKNLNVNQEWWKETQDVNTFKKYTGTWITKEIEKQAAIKIQNLIRRYIQNKREQFRKEHLQDNFLRQMQEKEQQSISTYYQQSLICFQQNVNKQDTTMASNNKVESQQQQSSTERQNQLHKQLHNSASSATVTAQQQQQQQKQQLQQQSPRWKEHVKNALSKKPLLTEINTNMTTDHVMSNNSVNFTSPNSLITSNFNNNNANNNILTNVTTLTTTNNAALQNNNNMNIPTQQQENSLNISTTNVILALQKAVQDQIKSKETSETNAINEKQHTQPQQDSTTQNMALTTKTQEKPINIAGMSTKNLLNTYILGEISKKPKLQLKQRKLFQAAKTGNLFLAQNSGFVYTAKDVNCYDESGFTPLLYAAQKADRQFVKYLIMLGADVNMPSNEGITPLHLAFQSGDEALILLIIQNKGDLNRLTVRGETPIAYGNVQILEKLGLRDAVAIINLKEEDHQMFFDNNEYYKQQFQKITKDKKKKDQNNLINHLDFQFDYIKDYLEPIKGVNQVDQIPELKTFMTPQNKQDLDNKKDVLKKILQAKKELQEQKDKENQSKRNKL